MQEYAFDAVIYVISMHQTAENCTFRHSKVKKNHFQLCLLIMSRVEGRST